MNIILVISPHPDDETLGAGGAILRHKAFGDKVFWLIITTITQEQGFTISDIERRNFLVKEISRQYNFDGVFDLGFPTTMLDTISFNKLIKEIGDVFNKVSPNIVYLPFYNDVHTDHKIVFQASLSCIKWFRYPSIKKVMMMEILSESDFGFVNSEGFFSPNVFVDISDHLERKIEIMKIYNTEIGEHPFPRSEKSIRSLAYLRGSMAGIKAAEGFMLIKEIIF